MLYQPSELRFMVYDTTTLEVDAPMGYVGLAVTWLFSANESPTVPSLHLPIPSQEDQCFNL